MTCGLLNDHRLAFLSIYFALKDWFLTFSQQVDRTFNIRSYVLNVCDL
jgi:hypothetical protein